MNQLSKLIIICGPTAVGKTSVGVELCRRLGGEIVSADSQQVYRGMDIGTAKDDLAGCDIPCHLIDVVTPDQLFDAATFMEAGDAAVADILSRKKVPIVVGGTGLYLRALLEGLCEAPSRDPSIRDELLEIAAKEGKQALHKILQKEDPVMAGRLHPNDLSRVMRAIEVKRVTGQSLSEIQESHTPDKRYDSLKVGLMLDREILYDRINQRVDHMMAAGLEGEVKKIIEQYGDDLQSLKAVGYREMVSYLKGEMELEEAIRLTKQNTRHFAKRQMTWFRSDSDIQWFPPDKIDDIETASKKFLNS